jgi:hypothetical protein
MPVAPLGSVAVLPPTTFVASGSVIPSADPTLEPLGHWAAAVDAVAVGAATVGVAAADDEVEGVGVVLDPPQAARVAANGSAISGIKRWLRPVTRKPSVCNVEGVRLSTGALCPSCVVARTIVWLPSHKRERDGGRTRHIMSPMVESLDFRGLHLVDDVSSADWIVSSVRNFEYDVGSLLPVTFEAYARVLHPASRRFSDGDPIDVRWSDVAAANGRIAHSAMEWVAITGDWRFMYQDAQPGIWDRAPSIGSLPSRQATILAEVLGRFTSTPSDCWFAVWDGYGNMPARLRTVPMIEMPNRRMVALRGPLPAAGTAFSRWTWPDSASLWWPDDRAWCVATDIDLQSTYIGAGAEGIDAVVANNSLESYAVSIDQGVHWKSDTINPTPAPTSRGPRPTPPGDTPER